MPRYNFTINIKPDQYQAYYSGQIKQIVVKTEQGLTVRFPAKHLQQFITREGISGRFTMQLDADNRLIGIERIT